MTRTAAPDSSLTDSLRGFFGVPFRGQTYRSLAYLLVAFPLGIAYFTAVSVGVATGLGLLITLVGVPILLVTLYGVTLIAGFEASLARHLVGMDVPTPDSLKGDERTELTSVDGLLAWTRRIVTAPTTWTALALVGVKFVFGTAVFAVLSVAVVLSLALLAAPVAVLTDLPVQVGSATDGLTVGVTTNGAPLWVVDTLPEAAVVAVVGLFATLVTLHLVNALAKFGAISTAALLDVGGDERTPA
jgi:hypothetical protein